MPGANAKALEKAKTLPADVLIFDLEDSVAPEAKGEARERVVEAVKAGGYGKREIVVRVNALSTPWGPEDFVAVVAAKPDGVLVPKIQGPGDVWFANDGLGATGPALWMMIETPRAILDMAIIASATTRLQNAAFVMGLNDLAKDTRAKLGGDRAPFHAAMSIAVTAARVYGLTVIDGVYNDIADTAGFEAECRQGRDFGFDGKTLIHPSQIDAANTIFAPTPEELTRARAVIAAFALPENAGKGVIKVDGRMTELLHLEEAKRVVAVAEAISQTT